MSTFTKHTVSGRVSRKPELNYTPNGTASTSFSLAHQVRRLNRQTNQWEDGDLTWYDVQVYGRLAENVVESVDKGVTVTVIGNLKTRSYTTKDGRNGVSLDLTADDVLISLDHQTAQVSNTRAYGTQNGNANGQQNNQPRQNSSYNQQNAAAPAQGNGSPFDAPEPF